MQSIGNYFIYHLYSFNTGFPIIDNSPFVILSQTSPAGDIQWLKNSRFKVIKSERVKVLYE